LGACTDYDFDQPDTDANRAGFERHFGFAPPPSVSDLYYYADELGADVKYQLGFRADEGTIDTIVAELELVQEEPEYEVRLARDLDWWHDDVIRTLTPYWRSDPDSDYYRFLWYDPAGRRAYYLEFSV
jgi:hypothetical protein